MFFVYQVYVISYYFYPLPAIHSWGPTIRVWTVLDLFDFCFLLRNFNLLITSAIILFLYTECVSVCVVTCLSAPHPNIQ